MKKHTSEGIENDVIVKKIKFEKTVSNWGLVYQSIRYTYLFGYAWIY